MNSSSRNRVAVSLTRPGSQSVWMNVHSGDERRPDITRRIMMMVRATEKVFFKQTKILKNNWNLIENIKRTKFGLLRVLRNGVLLHILLGGLNNQLKNRVIYIRNQWQYKATSLLHRLLLTSLNNLLLVVLEFSSNTYST